VTRQAFKKILVRDDEPRTRDRDDHGYGVPLVTTHPESTAEDLVARYASRGGIEQAFGDASQIMGVGEARNRTRGAVERTVPFGLICFGLVTVWYALRGHAPDDVRLTGSGSVVHHEDRTVLRRHGHQTPAGHHRRQISPPMP